MEPLDSIIRIGADGVDYWAGSQAPTLDQQAIARIVGVPATTVRIHTLLAGVSVGRPATPDSDVAGEPASIAKAIGGGRAVTPVRTRDDDVHDGGYRALYVPRPRA